jgi:spore germination protein
MIIHVVQPGETIQMIADQYGISVERLLQENEYVDRNKLVIGQTIIIVYPRQTYTVKDGDTLSGIAELHGVTVLQLLRNNPYLSDREFIYPGETIVISYEAANVNKISTNGFAYPYVNKNTLKKSLPFLTYLSVFYYRITNDGNLIDIDDTEIIELAKAYHVAPLMVISSLITFGTPDPNLARILLSDEASLNRLINNILSKLKEKGYYGLNIDPQYIPPEVRPKFAAFIAKITARLNEEGYYVLVTINLSTYELEQGLIPEDNYLKDLGQAANTTMLLPYAWGQTEDIPAILTPFESYINILDYAVTQIPPEKLFIGFSDIGYIFQLPFEEGISYYQILTYENAIKLARETNSIIQYDEVTQSAFFYYSDENDYIVWFKDARSVDSIMRIVSEYSLPGVGIWNVMYYPSQVMFVINVQFEIENVLHLSGNPANLSWES